MPDALLTLMYDGPTFGGPPKMRSYPVSTVDVFTNERFGGNPLAVFTDARGVSDAEMLALAREMNLSETTFVLPPENPANSARIRIFNRRGEMPFAGHPNVGTAFVLAASGMCAGDILRFEEPAGIVEIRVIRSEAGDVRGAAIDAPQALTVLGELNPRDVAACIGLSESQILTGNHPPTHATVGIDFVVAEVTNGALSAAAPNAAAFAETAAAHGLTKRLAILLYDPSEECVRARMFAPLHGTPEDPATGAAIATLGALLLSNRDDDEVALQVRQGVEMGRPSLISVKAWRADGSIHASVGGECVPVLTGRVIL